MEKTVRRKLLKNLKSKKIRWTRKTERRKSPPLNGSGNFKKDSILSNYSVWNELSINNILI